MHCTSSASYAIIAAEVYLSCNPEKFEIHAVVCTFFGENSALTVCLSVLVVALFGSPLAAVVCPLSLSSFDR